MIFGGIVAILAPTAAANVLVQSLSYIHGKIIIDDETKRDVDFLFSHCLDPFFSFF